MVLVPIDAKTKLLGLLGNPVEHSLSPVIHGELAKRYGQNAAYLAFGVEENQLEQVLHGAKGLKVAGMNVTVPYKQAVMPYLVKLDEQARLLGAVNTLVPCEQGYQGYNTDMPGLQRAMRRDGVSVCGQNVVVLGAGGVANAILGMLMEDGAKEILILNRSLNRGQVLAERFTQAYGKENIKVMTYEDDYLAYMESRSEDKWIAMQATSVGMYPKIEAAPIENTAFYERIAVGYDMIFNPYETKFMRLVKEHGGLAYNGLKMLLYQGIAAFELWTGVNVVDQDADEIFEGLRRELGDQ